MPGHRDCCLVPVATWLARHMPDVPVSLMTAYLPVHRAALHPGMNRTNRQDEAEEAGRLLGSLGLRRVPWQMAETPGVKDAERSQEIWIDRDGRLFADVASGALISVLKRLSGEFIIDASGSGHRRRRSRRRAGGEPHADRSEHPRRD
jgi:hypothetical protein